MTVHAAKGLEWDAVFVAGLTAKVFPVEGQAVADWTKQLATLPFPLRGDRGELPELQWQLSTDQAGARSVQRSPEHRYRLMTTSARVE
jgi:DNA helicase-2/ATP-dependent DNA helicase PcrA